MICKQVGYAQGGKVMRGPAPGTDWSDGNSMPITTGNRKCEAHSKNIFECPTKRAEMHDCDHKKDVGAECFGPRVAPAGSAAAGSAGECEDVEVKVGGKGGGSHTIPSLDVTECPAVVDKSNWLGGYKYGDSFDVEVKDSQAKAGAKDVIVTRKDSPGSGWGMNLKFMCKR